MLFGKERMVKSMTFDLEDILNKDIKYKDYLGFDRSGKIGYIEPYNGDKEENDDKTVAWIYVVDNDPEYNVHTFLFQDTAGNTVTLQYADMRLSTEIVLDL